VEVAAVGEGVLATLAVAVVVVVVLLLLLLLLVLLLLLLPLLLLPLLLLLLLLPLTSAKCRMRQEVSLRPSTCACTSAVEGAQPSAPGSFTMPRSTARREKSVSGEGRNGGVR
jgi:hypothetical protein